MDFRWDIVTSRNTLKTLMHFLMQLRKPASGRVCSTSREVTIADSAKTALDVSGLDVRGGKLWHKLDCKESCCPNKWKKINSSPLGGSQRAWCELWDEIKCKNQSSSFSRNKTNKQNGTKNQISEIPQWFLFSQMFHGPDVVWHKRHVWPWLF